MQKGIESNIWKYTILLITSRRLFMTILGVYLLATVPDTTIKTVGALLAIGNIAGVIFEVPSGYLSDKMGHKNALILGRLFMLASCLLYVVGGTIPIFLLASALMNIGMAFTSGTGEAFMHETLKVLGRDKEYSEVMGRMTAIGYAVPIVLIVLIPFFVSIDFKIPFIISAIVDVIGVIAALSLVSPKQQKVKVKEIGFRNFAEVIREGYRLGFIKYTVFAGIAAGVISSTSSFKDVYQAGLGIPVIYFGIFWGISRAIVALILTQSGKIKKRFTFHEFLRFRMLGAFFLIAWLAIPNPYVVVTTFILIAAFNWSIGQVETHYFLDIVGESSHKATLLSFSPLVFWFTVAVFQIIVSHLISLVGYSTGFTWSLVMFMAILVPFYFYVVRDKGSTIHDKVLLD